MLLKKKFGFIKKFKSQRSGFFEINIFIVFHKSFNKKKKKEMGQRRKKIKNMTPFHKKVHNLISSYKTMKSCFIRMLYVEIYF